MLFKLHRKRSGEGKGWSGVLREADVEKGQHESRGDGGEMIRLGVDEMSDPCAAEEATSSDASAMCDGMCRRGHRLKSVNVVPPGLYSPDVYPGSASSSSIACGSSSHSCCSSAQCREDVERCHDGTGGGPRTYSRICTWVLNLLSSLRRFWFVLQSLVTSP